MFYDDPQWLREQYEICGTIAEMSRRFGVSVRMLSLRMDKFNIPHATTTWKGGKTSKGRGYILVKVDYPHPGATKHGYVMEHRLVMEQHLGRFLETSEHVHHINGDRSDNRLENLQLVSPKEHRDIHGGFKPRTRKAIAKVIDLRENGWLVDEIANEVGLSGVIVNRILNAHTDYTCKLCGRTFKQNKGLGMHITRTHRWHTPGQRKP